LLGFCDTKIFVIGTGFVLFYKYWRFVEIRTADA